MPNRWIERKQAIMNGLLSLIVNDCNALECLKKQGRQALYDGVVLRVRPTLKVCAGEAAEMQSQIRRDSVTIESIRQALESVVANVPRQHMSESTIKLMRAALPGHPNLA